jgi:hypothetical protein
MGRNDLFRVGLSVCVIAFWAISGVRIRASPLMKAKEVVACHIDEGCTAGRPYSTMSSLIGSISREMGCAVMADSLWGQRVPYCETESLHLTMREILIRVEALSMKVHTYEFVGKSSDHFIIAFRYGLSQSKGRQLLFDFSRMGDHYYIKDIHGLCELFTYLSLAAREQSSSPVVKES